MKSYLLVSLLIVTVTAIAAAPLEPLIEYEPLEMTEYDDTALPDGRAMRQRRVTCDLLSAGGFVGDTACAANCLSMGKAGGHCNGSGVCVCRSESFKDLWDKRFGG